MRQCVYICLFLTICFAEAFSQDQSLFKKNFLDAEYFFITEEYQEAVYLYSELLKIDPDNANIHFLLGACYLSLYGQKDQAIPHLEQAVRDLSPSYREGSYKERSAPREALFALARAYHIAEEFDKAIEQYEKYRSVMIKKRFADIEYVNHQIKSCELAKSMVKRPIDIEHLRLSDKVNRFESNYNPIVSWDDSTLIYMTNRPLYRAIVMVKKLPGGRWTEPREINEEIGSDGNSYPASLSANGKELYIIKKDAYSSDIYISYLKNDRFTKMLPLNKHINSDYTESHACISFNGKSLYFTSDRPGGQGALDIWVSETTNEGDWGEPRNLGPKINSHYSEETPFLASRGNKLYFSSQGHATMGGFDYFSAEKLPTGTSTPVSEPEKGRRSEERYYDEGWSFPENLGYPINTADDDLFYYPRKSGTGAYYSAILKDIHPDRSIYIVRRKDEEPQIAVVKKGTREETDTAAEETSVLSGTSGSSTGTDNTIPPAETTGRETTGTTGAETSGTGEGIPAPGDEYYVLNSILFGFDSEDLNKDAIEEANRVLEVMQNNPEVKLKLTGHADAVGDINYNLALSERRAQSVADFLIAKGIDASRIKVSAAGETNPIAINRYEDGTDSPEGRKLNRHVSIKLENMQSENIRVEDVFVPDRLRPKFDQSYSVLLVNSNEFLDTVPDVVAGEHTMLIITDSAFLYTAGNFRHKLDARGYLNEVLDSGYPDAGMLEARDLEDLININSDQGIIVTARYTIQFMALRNPIPVEKITNLEGVVKYAGRDGFNRYVHGDYGNVREAMDMLITIKAMGYHDAFIMSILRYKKISE